MSWGCYKHEWDEGSLSWRNAYLKAAEREEQKGFPRWGRHGAICPACYLELERNARELDRALVRVQGIAVSVSGKFSKQRLVQALKDIYDAAVEAHRDYGAWDWGNEDG